MNNLAVIIIDMQEKAIIDNKRELLSAQINLLDYAIKNNLNVYTFSISHAGKLIPELMPKLKGRAPGDKVSEILKNKLGGS